MIDARSFVASWGAPVATAAVLLLFVFDPATTWWFPSCPLRALTGLLCPFCGSLRALHALLHGAPALAFELNPLVTAGGASALAALAHDLTRSTHSSAFDRLTRLCFSPGGVALVVLFGILRNIPDAPAWIVH